MNNHNGEKTKIQSHSNFTSKVLKESTENSKVELSIPYCGLQNALRCEDRTTYKIGILGWDYDVYQIGNATLYTGYRDMPGYSPSPELRKSIEALAKQIIEKYPDFDSQSVHLRKNLENFIDMAIKEKEQVQQVRKGKKKKDIPDSEDNMKFAVTMYNGSASLDTAIVTAGDENEAVEKYIKLNNPIIYAGDRFEAEPYLETVIKPDFARKTDAEDTQATPKASGQEK